MQVKVSWLYSKSLIGKKENWESAKVCVISVIIIIVFFLD